MVAPRAPQESRLDAAKWLLRRTNPFLNIYDTVKSLPEQIYSLPGQIGNSVNDFLAVTTPSQRTTEGLPSHDQLLSAASVAFPEAGSLPLAGAGAAARLGESAILDGLSAGPAFGAYYGMRPNRLKSLWHGSTRAEDVLAQGFQRGTNVEYMVPGVSTSTDPSLALHFTREDPVGNPDKVFRAIPSVDPKEVRNIRPSENADLTGATSPIVQSHRAVGIPAGGLDEAEVFFPTEAGPHDAQGIRTFVKPPAVAPRRAAPNETDFVKRSGYKFKFTDALTKFNDGFSTDDLEQFISPTDLLTTLKEKPKFGGLERRFYSLAKIPMESSPHWTSPFGQIYSTMFPRETSILQNLARDAQEGRIAANIRPSYDLRGKALDDSYRRMNAVQQKLDKQVESAVNSISSAHTAISKQITPILSNAISDYGPNRVAQAVQSLSAQGLNPLQISRKLDSELVSMRDTERRWGFGPTAPQEDFSSLPSKTFSWEPGDAQMTPWTAEEYADWQKSEDAISLQQKPFDPRPSILDLDPGDALPGTDLQPMAQVHEIAKKFYGDNPFNYPEYVDFFNSKQWQGKTPNEIKALIKNLPWGNH